MMLSNCCTAPSWGEIHDNSEDQCNPIGFCSECREHCEFEEYFNPISSGNK